MHCQNCWRGTMTLLVFVALIASGVSRADEITDNGTTGNNGVNGQDGDPATAGGDGEAGGDANAAAVTIGAAENLSDALGGDGGRGGDGGVGLAVFPDMDANGGAGGMGGRGGNANAFSLLNAQNEILYTAEALGTGGEGGDGGQAGLGIGAGLNGIGGRGGSGGEGRASAQAFATNDGKLGLLGLLEVFAEGVGGRGGDARGLGAVAGDGGLGVLDIDGVSVEGSGRLNGVVTGNQFGGNGGTGFDGANGGNGADSTIVDRVSGSLNGAALHNPRLNLNQTAQGGNGGSTDGGQVGIAGIGSSTLSLENANPGDTLGTVAVEIIGRGGDGGHALGGSNGGAGGLGTGSVDIGYIGTMLDVGVFGVGGDGGDSTDGIAGNGTAGQLETVWAGNPFGEIELTAGRIGGSGGNGFGSGTGGNGASIEIENELDDLAADTISWTQIASAGDAGSAEQGAPGNAGDAFSIIGDDFEESPIPFSATGGATINAQAFGGRGGQKNASTGSASDGGEAYSSTLAVNNDGSANIISEAFGGAGGDGLGGANAGDGALAEAYAFGALSGDVGREDLEVIAEAVGGNGGSALLDGLPGQGGHADSFVEADTPALTDRFSDLDVTADAQGGNGGAIFGDVMLSGDRGRGGNADTGAIALASGDVRADVLAVAVGGMGGSRQEDAIGDGGRGGDAMAFANLTTANDSVEDSEVIARAIGGEGGAGRGPESLGGMGGTARVTDVFGATRNSGSIEVRAEQIGGKGGDGFDGASGADGQSSVLDDVIDVRGNFTSATQFAVGGEGGAAEFSSGGDGGNASSTIRSDVGGGGGGGGGATSNPSVFSKALGGRGGDATGWVAGRGGHAVATGDLENLEFGDSALFVTATGGRGGDGIGGFAGDGGSATVNSVRGESLADGPVEVVGTAVGGRGGDGIQFSEEAPAGVGGDGASVELINEVSGRTTAQLIVEQRAIGGSAGNGDGLNSTPGDAGDAISRFLGYTEPVSSLTARADGGLGGIGSATVPGTKGGDAEAETNFANPFNGAAANARATGGDGGRSSQSHGGPGGRGFAASDMTGDGGRAIATAIGGDGGKSDVRDGGMGGEGLAAAHARSGGGIDHGDGVTSLANSFGGDGGATTPQGFPGNGGNADSTSTATAFGNAAFANAFATAGRGGAPGGDEGLEGNPGQADAYAVAQGASGGARARATVPTGLITALKAEAQADTIDDMSVSSTARAHRGPGARIMDNTPDNATVYGYAFFGFEKVGRAQIKLAAIDEVPSEPIEYEGEVELSLKVGDLTPAQRSLPFRGIMRFNSFGTVDGEDGPYIDGTINVRATRQTSTDQLNMTFTDPKPDELIDALGGAFIDLGDGDVFGPELDLKLSVTLTTDNPASGIDLDWTFLGLIDPDRALTNGSFDFGSLDWDLSARNSTGESIETPHITFPTSPSGNRFGQFKTGEYADDVIVSTLSQPITVTEDEPILSFDFTLAEVVEDLTGEALSEMSDRVEVLVDDGQTRFLLLTIDEFSAIADPDGNAPGETALNLPLNAEEFDFNFAADLTGLVGSDLTLIIDVINEDNGLRLDPNLDNFQFTSAPPTVPEPSTLTLLVLGCLCLVTRRARKRAR